MPLDNVRSAQLHCQAHPTMDVPIDVNEFRSFCFRGEGRANFVISAKNVKSGERIVWRLSKDKKTGHIATDSKCYAVTRFMDTFVAPFFDESFLLNSSIVLLPVDALFQLAKIPSLPMNTKIENWKDLADVARYPDSLSCLPMEKVPKDMKFVSALQMPDATQIEKVFPSYIGPTITVELKPKQGFFQHHPDVPVRFCNNCILQLEKSHSDAFDKMYDFCPIDLFSGELPKMRKAIRSLIDVPHRNLRIFSNGVVIHSDEAQLSRSDLNTALFPLNRADVNILVDSICYILAGMTDNNRDFKLQEDSILATLLETQMIDTVGIVRAYSYFNSLPLQVQKDVEKHHLDSTKGLCFLQKTDKRSRLERYLLAATMKDCSIMLSLRMVDTSYISGKDEKVFRMYKNDTEICFAFSIKVVDLDPKSPKNLLNAFKRFMKGVELIKLNPSIHKPCI
ncbi:hypothetical protein QR680_015434 [Steinernema hermaphroditum]|uniref:Inositol-pentakisphosphate 2-kinase n=1 Tax=Steinernema hermaphroditum TaxID=289476 RepID=A0AA39H7M9_9BILA|nr:hypothetical protein QR680_015434 [Steinernema hermaphroditum]